MSFLDFAKDDRESLIINTVITMGIVIGVAFYSFGVSLIVTFVPGLVLSWICLLVTSQRQLPDPQKVLSWYLLAIGVHLLHFAEKFIMGFHEKFPALFDESTAYPADQFITTNMAMYFAFIVAGIAFYKGLKVPMILMWFFAINSVMGNAIAFPVYALMSGGYFPGLYTSICFWVLGPILLIKMFR